MEIADIKKRLSILTVLQHYNLQPDKNSRINCPFHNDRTPSMQVYPETGTVFCFSSNCKLHGKAIDQIDFILHKENCTKHEAIKKAKEMLNYMAPAIKNEIQPKPQTDLSILPKIYNYFRNGFIMRKDNKARNYLEGRNLDVGKLENLGISFGYNSAQFHHRNRISEQDMKACEQAGLLIKSTNGSKTGFSYTPWAAHCAIFPLTDEKGNITGMYGRSTMENSKSKHFYLKNSKGLFYHPKKDTEKLIITESIIDFLSLYQIDEIRNQYGFLPIYGTNRLTEEHKQAIAKLENLQEIIFFLDGDKAGNEAAKKYSKELSTDKASAKSRTQCLVSTVDTPENEDINSLLQGHELDIFTHLLNNRQAIVKTHGHASQSKQSEIVKTHDRASQRLNTTNPSYITYKTNALEVDILGGINLQQLDRLRVTLKIKRTGSNDPLHVIRHTIDLYHSDYLEKFINKASEQLEAGTNTIGRAIAEMTEGLEQYRVSKLESMKEQKPKLRQLTEQRYKKAIKYLSSSKLMERTNTDIGKTGMIGEKNNRLLMYLVFTSRLREHPLHIISLGASGTGKTYLQEKISALIPEQDKLEITILSENAFYYFDRKELKNKLVLIEDMDGAENVLYPLRELQSKMRISKTIPLKDSKGNLKTITLHVEGPICLAGTTTREKLYEDNANRSLLIYLDGSKQHKEHIMDYQRRLSAGKINSKAENELKEFFKDMQTVLKPIKVRNPYAEMLKLPDYVFKPLRTNAHYLAVIETITFYHQYQRQVKTDPATGEKYIETTLEDIEWANRLLKDVLLAKSDELSGQCRRFFENLKSWMAKNNKESFYKSEIRDAFRMNPNNLKYYLVQLIKYNRLKIVGGSRYKSGYEYEITNRSEYTELQNSMETALDNALNAVKKKLVDNVDSSGQLRVVTHSNS